MSFNNTKTPLKPKTKAKYQLPTLPGGKYYMTEEQEKKFKELFPVHTDREVAEWFGIGMTTARKLAKELSLVKDRKESCRLGGIRHREMYRMRLEGRTDARRTVNGARKEGR